MDCICITPFLSSDHSKSFYTASHMHNIHTHAYTVGTAFGGKVKYLAQGHLDLWTLLPVLQSVDDPLYPLSHSHSAGTARTNISYGPVLTIKCSTLTVAFSAFDMNRCKSSSKDKLNY